MKKLIKIIFCLLTCLSLSSCSIADIGNALFPKAEEKQAVDENNNANPKSLTLGIVNYDTYNPFLTQSSTVKNVLGFIFEPLFGINADMSTEGILAKSYLTSSDGKSITINLKENVMFHDETYMTANDVIYTINYIKNNNGSYSQRLSDVTNVRKNSDYSIVVDFARSVPNPVALFSFPIVKNMAFDNGEFNPIGTGPFYYAGDKLLRFEQHHDKISEIDYIDLMNVPDMEKYMSLLNVSVLDVANSYTVDMLSFMPKNNTTVSDFTSNSMVFVGFNANSSVFKFEETRKSIASLINRKNIVNNIYFSRASASAYPINPQSYLYPDNGSFDDKGVETILKEKGWTKDKNGNYCLIKTTGLTYFSVNILVNAEDENRVKVAEQISKDMSNNGMINSVVKCSSSEFANKVNSGNYDMFIGETELNPNNDLYELLGGDGNILNYSNKEADALMAQIGTLNSEDDIKNVWGNLINVIDKDTPLIPICFLKESLITSAKLESGCEPSIEGFVRRTEKWSIK